MNTFLKKFTAIMLMVMVILITIVAIMAVWDIIEVKNVFSKTFGSLLIVFASSSVVLFIYSLIFKGKE